MTRRGYRPPNYTQVPNRLLDEELPKIDSLAELKVLFVVARATIGWHEREHALTMKELEARTGMARASVVEGVKKALAAGRLQRRQQGRAHLYALRMNSPDSGQVPGDGLEVEPLGGAGGSDSSLAGGLDSEPPLVEKESVERNGGDERKPGAVPLTLVDPGEQVPTSPKTVDRKATTGRERQLAWKLLRLFNETFGTQYRSTDHVEKIIRRIREHPEVTEEQHADILTRNAAAPWWDGTPGPNVIYGNGAQFERSMVARPKTRRSRSEDAAATLEFARRLQRGET